ncbi:TPA: hypothetical protein ACGWVL_004778 [Pseudomonas aeruginosa]
MIVLASGDQALQLYGAPESCQAEYIALVDTHLSVNGTVICPVPPSAGDVALTVVPPIVFDEVRTTDVWPFASVVVVAALRPPSLVVQLITTPLPALFPS